MIFQAIRSAAFYAIWLGHTALLAVVVGTIGVVTRRPTKLGWALSMYWVNSSTFLLRWIVGIRSRVEGAENIPPGPCIFASKHMSDWDIFALVPYAERPAYIAKKELMDIPFFGWAAATYDTIRIDRSLGTGAIPAMIEEARAALGRGCRIVIYPEGTRREPLAPPDYRQGIVSMYVGLNVPVVPVALDSGLYWPRNSLILWPGTARARFLAPILPGLSSQEFRKELARRIESATNEMILEAVEKGVTRPISPEMREKLDALAAASSPAATTTY